MRRREFPCRDAHRQVSAGIFRCIRQHQRLLDAGITLSRSTVVYWTSRAIDLLAPLADAQSAHVLASGVLAMDETSLKAGRAAKGKMRTGCCGRCTAIAEEGVFHYAPSRAHRHVHEFLGPYRGTLLSDGYEAYAACAAQRPGEVTHALCWAHTRRYFERAKDSEPEAVAEALTAHRGDVRSREANPCRRARRRGQARLPPGPYPGGRRDLLAVVPHAMSSPRTATEEPVGEGVALRAGAPLGVGGLPRRPRGGHRHEPPGAGAASDSSRKRNWLFTSSEVGAQRVGIIQSLLVTCRLHEVDVYTYLVDVFQRISVHPGVPARPDNGPQNRRNWTPEPPECARNRVAKSYIGPLAGIAGVHPANRAIELTPRMGKSRFADAPMRSDLGPHHHDPPSH